MPDLLFELSKTTVAALDRGECLILVLPTFGESLGAVVHRSRDGIGLRTRLQEFVIKISSPQLLIEVGMIHFIH